MLQIIFTLMILLFVCYGMDFRPKQGVSQFVPNWSLNLMKASAIWILLVYSWVLFNLESFNSIIMTGIGVQILGLSVIIYAKLSLKHSFTWTGMYKNDGELITSGPYRFVRHPLYCGVFAFEIGGVVVFLNQGLNRLSSDPIISCLIAFPPLLYVMLFNLLMSRKESKRLEEVYGEAYQAYKAKTPAYFPKLTAKNNLQLEVEQC